MTNQPSLPSLLFPVISTGWCPQGDVGQIFQNWQDTYGSQVIVNIPGIENLNPATIAEIQAELVIINNEIDALDKYYRNGVASVSTGNSTVVVPFSSAVANTLYDITILPVGNGTEVDDPWSWALVSGSRTTGGFSVRFVAVPATITSFEWTIRER